MDRVQVWRRLELHNNIVDLAVVRFVINRLDRARAWRLPAGPSSSVGLAANTGRGIQPQRYAPLASTILALPARPAR